MIDEFISKTSTQFKARMNCVLTSKKHSVFNKPMVVVKSLAQNERYVSGIFSL
jgi:hypothetical protein